MKTPLPTRVPVLVVGAGPTGLTCANLLASLGIEVLLVERNASTADLPRAVALDDEGARTLDAIDLTPRIEEITFESTGSRYFLDDGECFAAVGSGQSVYGFAKRQYFHQPDLERVLLQGAAQRSNLKIRFNSTLHSFEQSIDGVRCRIETDDGGSTVVNADYLLACDGGGSTIRAALGINMQGETYGQDWLVLDLAEDADQVRFSRFHCATSRPWVSIPAPYGGRRYEFMLLDGESSADMLTMETIRALLAPVREVTPKQVIRKAVYTFHARVAQRYRDGRVFLLGDAAHMTPPFAGQGMNAGLRDAHNLAWKLAAVLNAHADDALLDSYECERREPTWAMVKLAVAMGEVVMPVGQTGTTFRDALVAGLARFPEVRDYLLEMRFKPKPRYDAGLFVGLDAEDRLQASLVGTMIPQPTVTLQDGESCLLDRLLGNGFALIAQDETAEHALYTLQHPLWLTLAPRLLSFAISPDDAPPPVMRCRALQPELFRPLRTHRDQLLLIRPDRYVAGAFSPADAEQFAITFAAMLKLS